ncbi:hypothetical protein KDX13_24935 [Burkholderia cenocepacia]|uniref:hypothetical protein n=1 Tax=Burkholderia cenocepacia TaxID=95486 RepID=UPI001B9876F9|nr:hypothetical protein [Burkholderia cenocepacia]MBR8099994.1 hypothetical protein [Burkholderia cenocepacia]
MPRCGRPGLTAAAPGPLLVFVAAPPAVAEEIDPAIEIGPICCTIVPAADREEICGKPIPDGFVQVGESIRNLVQATGSGQLNAGQPIGWQTQMRSNRVEQL